MIAIDIDDPNAAHDNWVSHADGMGVMMTASATTPVPRGRRHHDTPY